MAADANSLIEQAPAKVNLYLHLCGQREDGYHLLDSLAVFPDISDTVSFETAPDLSLQITGPEAGALTADEDNLVLRAARNLAIASGNVCGARLTLQKNLPVASGIGGGSSDAAAALRLLSRHWRCDVPGAIALRIGADVPVCLCAPDPTRMRGIGEVLTSVPTLPRFGILLVNPRVEVPTPAVFKAVTDKNPRPGPSMPERFGGFQELVAWLKLQRNDLQPAAEGICTEVGQVLTALAEAPLSRMSGSGATCFGLYPSKEDAARAGAHLRAKNPDWWIAAAEV
ncbi:MAG: 4-(cytidine 5'-diphospho)-2-C-methyl-D-erythritol kinase [Pseudomonadota bacterium]